MANWVRYPLPLCRVFPPWRAFAKWRCDSPPPQKGYLSDTCAIPYENKENACDTPLCDTISKGYCAIWGGISHWAAKPVGSQELALKVPKRGQFHAVMRVDMLRVVCPKCIWETDGGMALVGGSLTIVDNKDTCMTDILFN